MVADSPLSFLRVTRPEVHFAEGTDPYRPEVYQRGRDELQRLMRAGSLRRDAEPGIYVYRQTMGAQQQTGWVGLASCEEYRQGSVRRHELTRPDKENDRVRHIETVQDRARVPGLSGGTRLGRLGCRGDRPGAGSRFRGCGRRTT